MSNTFSILIVWASRWSAFGAICGCTEAVITQRLPFNSWQEALLLALAAFSWTYGEFELNRRKARQA